MIGVSLAVVVKTAMAPAAPTRGAELSPRLGGHGVTPARSAAAGDSRLGPKRVSSSARTADGPTIESKGVIERAVDSMESLSRVQTTDEAAAERALHEDVESLTDPSGVPDPAWIPGRLIPGSLRVLDTGLGEDDGTLYAFRTDRGRVCGGLAGKGSGCLEDFTQERGVTAMTLFRSDGSLVIYGFAPDRVETVRVAVDGYSVSAPVRNNGYFVELASTWPSVIELEIIPPADGVSETITIPLADAPQGPGGSSTP